LAYRHKYGVAGAGSVSRSLIGRLPSKEQEIGPVVAISYRVASRIANALRAGYPARIVEELNSAPVILFHSPSEQAGSLLKILENAAIHWTDKVLICCDCPVGKVARHVLEARGAAIAVVREFGLPGRMIVEAPGGAALQAAQRLVRRLHIKAIEISPSSADRFDAAVTIGSGALTALIDQAAGLLRSAGIRDTEAARIVSSLFEQTAREYARSGKQSWIWYIRKPSAAALQAQIESVGPQLQPVLRELLLLGMETFGKHSDVAARLNINEE
jgi:hypothetical protein